MTQEENPIARHPMNGAFDGWNVNSDLISGYLISVLTKCSIVIKRHSEQNPNITCPQILSQCDGYAKLSRIVEAIPVPIMVINQGALNGSRHASKMVLLC